jgi:hypothetical protein
MIRINLDRNDSSALPGFLDLPDVALLMDSSSWKADSGC